MIGDTIRNIGYGTTLATADYQELEAGGPMQRKFMIEGRLLTLDDRRRWLNCLQQTENKINQEVQIEN